MWCVVVSIFLVKGAYFLVRNLTYTPQKRDIIFHVSKSNQSTAIKIGTLSRYSHCGIIVIENGKPYVIEAERGVEKTPMKTWLRRGKMCYHYRVMRLREEQSLKVLYRLGGKYDSDFRFDMESTIARNLYGKYIRRMVSSSASRILWATITSSISQKYKSTSKSVV